MLPEPARIKALFEGAGTAVAETQCRKLPCVLPVRSVFKRNFEVPHAELNFMVVRRDQPVALARAMGAKNQYA